MDKPDDDEKSMKTKNDTKKKKMIIKRKSLTGVTIMMSMVTILGLSAVMMTRLKMMMNKMKK